MAFDRNDPTQLAELKNEVETDPAGIGYDTNTTNGVLDPINAEDFTVAKPKVSSALIRSACTYDAYNALSIDEQEWITWMTGSNGFQEENMEATDDLRGRLYGYGGTASSSIWAAGQRTEMNAAMQSIFEVPGSRAEILWGYDATISRLDWIAARDS